MTVGVDSQARDGRYVTRRGTADADNEASGW